jgi:hypothetical protein
VLYSSYAIFIVFLHRGIENVNSRTNYKASFCVSEVVTMSVKLNDAWHVNQELTCAW